MKLFNHLVVASCMCATSFSAFADDFYLNNTWNWGDLSNATKFTEISTDNDGNTTYQAMVGRLNAYSVDYRANYYLMSVDSKENKTYYNVSDGLKTVSEADLVNGKIEGLGTDSQGLENLDYEGITFTGFTTGTYASDNFQSYFEGYVGEPVKHMLLTLVVDKDGNVVSLNFKKPTDYNIPVGLPTYLVVQPSNTPLVKTGSYAYSAHFDKLTGSVRITDTTDSNINCLSLGARLYTKIYEDTAANQLVLFKSGDSQENHYEGKFEKNDIGGEMNLDLYQGTNGVGASYSIDIETTLYDVDLTFYYDMLYRKDTATLPERLNEDDEYIVNNPEGKVLFEETASMKTMEITKTLSAEELEDIFSKSYNGQLKIKYNMTQQAVDDVINNTQSSSSNFNFYLNTSNNNWDNETILMEFDSLTSDGELLYTTTLTDFDDAFYIDQLFTTVTTTNDESTTTTSNVDFKANSSDGVLSLEFAEEGSGSDTAVAQDVVAFSVNNEKKTTVTENGLPFYLRTTNGSQAVIKFYYNYANPSLSYVVIDVNGTVTGVENISVDNENAPVEFFNLNGVRVSGTTPGLYIRRQGNKATKVVVR